jgi:hypothetical protein
MWLLLLKAGAAADNNYDTVDAGDDVGDTVFAIPSGDVIDDEEAEEYADAADNYAAAEDADEQTPAKITSYLL